MVTLEVSLGCVSRSVPRGFVFRTSPWIKRSQTQGEIFTAPPHLCVEILSDEDTADYILEKIDDYLHFGVPYVWIINPRLRKGYVATKAGLVDAESGVLTTSDPGICVPVAELFDIG